MKLVPKMPIAWDSYRVVYHYLETTYNIEVTKGKKDILKVDNVEQAGNTFQLVNDDRVHDVVLMIKEN